MVKVPPEQLRGVILAAGRGSRLGALTEECPKGLVKVAGRSLVEWQLLCFQSVGIKEVFIVTGYKGEQFAELPATLIENPEWASGNMVSSLLTALSKIEQNARLIVSYSDIVYNDKTLRCLIHEDQDIVITYDLKWRELWEKRFVDPLSDAESFQIDSRGRIIEIGQSVSDIDEIQGQYMGLFSISVKGRQWIKDYLCKSPEQALQLDMTSLFSILVNLGRPIFGTPIAGGWCEIDTQRDLSVAEHLIQSQQLDLTSIV